MKKVFSVLLVFLFVVPSSFSQTSPLKKKVKINSSSGTIEKILDEISESGDISFAYNQGANDHRIVTLNNTEKTVEEFLNEMFDNETEYIEVGKKIIVRTKTQGVLKQIIRGKVIDADSEAPLMLASVIVINTDTFLGTITDTLGNFVIQNVPIGRQTVKVSYLGYEERIIPEIFVGSAKEVRLTIRLKESSVKIDEVVIKESRKINSINEMAAIGVKEFTVEETSRYPASVSDPARMAMAYAGVSMEEDFKNDIIVRGNSPRGMTWRIEGVPVPTPNHFAQEGTSGGGVCIISNNMLDNSEFYTGAWPAEYGNALSGVFDINLRNGNSHKKEYAAQVGMLGVDFAAEGPIIKGKNASYLINYRYSTLALFDYMGIKILGESEAIPDFQDLSFKFFIPSSKFGTFSLWGVGGISKLEEKSIIGYGTTYDNIVFNYLEESGDISESNMGALGLKHKIFLNNKTFIRSDIAVSGLKTYLTQDGRLEPSEAISAIGPEEIENMRNTFFYTGITINSKLNSRLSVRGGINSTIQKFNTQFLEYDYYNEEYDTLIQEEGNTSILQTYFQTKYKIFNFLSLYAGVNNLYFALNKNYTIEPRVALKLNITKRQSVTVGFGMHSQIQPFSQYLVKLDTDSGLIQPNKNLDFTKAYHYAVAYENMLIKDVKAKLEFYYQDLYNIPIIKDAQNEWSRSYSSINDWHAVRYFDLVNEGEGRNYGVELTLEKVFTKGWYAIFTGSLYESLYTSADSVEKNTRFNGNHTLNLICGKEFNIKKKNLLSMNLRVINVGGKRYTPVRGLEIMEDENGSPIINPVTGDPILYADYDFRNSYSKQLDDYLRVDFSLSYKINRPKVAHAFYFDIQNVFNRENVYDLDFYNVNSQEYVFRTHTGLIPIFKYRIEF